MSIAIHDHDPDCKQHVNKLLVNRKRFPTLIAHAYNNTRFLNNSYHNKETLQL